MRLCNYSLKSAATLFCLNDTMRYFLCPGKTEMREAFISLFFNKTTSQYKKYDVALVG
jgi:hypothetical protein